MLSFLLLGWWLCKRSSWSTQKPKAIKSLDGAAALGAALLSAAASWRLEAGLVLWWAAQQQLAERPQPSGEGLWEAEDGISPQWASPTGFWTCIQKLQKQCNLHYQIHLADLHSHESVRAVSQVRPETVILFFNPIIEMRLRHYCHVLICSSAPLCRAANLYFLFLTLLNWVPVVEAFQKEITMIPLLVVLTIIAIKDALEDFRRYLFDKKVNNNVVRVFCG